MPERAVLEVFLYGKGKRVKNVFRVLEAGNVPLTSITQPLGFTPDDPEFDLRSPQPEGVKSQVVRAGEHLRKKLLKNDDFRTAMTAGRTVTQQGPGTCDYPLFVKLNAPDAERVPWEVLFDDPPGSFMALHPQRAFPIGRMAESSSRPGTLKRMVCPSLRVAVVLGAALAGDVVPDEWAEWESLRAALESTGLPLEVFTLVSNADVEEKLTAQFAAWTAQGNGPPRVGRVALTSDMGQVLESLRTFGPNIIHFFCHGIAEPRPLLEVETFLDRQNIARGSILLDSAALGSLAGHPALWLMVLNCCQGGKSGRRMYSLARNIVMAGAPAVVAMRESVDALDATVFTEQFYGSLLPVLRDIVTSPGLATAGPSGVIVSEAVWVRAMCNARQRLSTSPNGRDPDSSPEWTYPVVYVHRDELHFVAAPAAPPPATGVPAAVPAPPAAAPAPVAPPPAAAPPAPAVSDEAVRLGATLDVLLQFQSVMVASGSRDEDAARYFADGIAGIRLKLGMPAEAGVS